MKRKSLRVTPTQPKNVNKKPRVVPAAIVSSPSKTSDANIITSKPYKSMYEKIREFRKTNIAPVDTVGCSKLAEDSADPKVKRYQLLTSLQLSSQTKDEINAVAMSNLKKAGLTVDNVIAMSEKELNSYICKVGFHNRKTVYMKKTAQILKDEYDSDIPDTIEGLLKLPGIGPKMGYLTLLCAWGICEGIGVDVHVHRISNRLGWVKSKNPEDTRLQLQELLPRDMWTHVNETLVGFGQIHCLPVNPMCSTCPVKNECPKVGTKSKK